MTTGNLFMILKALFGHWRRHKIQGATLLIGLATATALWTAVQAINTHAKESYERAAAAITSFQRAGFEAIDGGLIDEAAFASLRRAGFEVTPLVTGNLVSGDDVIAVMGIDPLSFSAAEGSGFSAPKGASMINFLELPGVLLTAPQSKKVLERLLLQFEPALRPTVKSSQGVMEGSAIGDIGAVQKLLGRAGFLNKLALPVDDLRTEADLPPPWDTRLVRVEPRAALDISSLTESFHLNLTAFGLLCFLVGLFIVYSAIGLAFEERIPSIRTLRVCGISLRQLLILMVMEMTVIAVVAGAVGVILGYGIASVLLPDVAASLRGLYGARLAGELVLDASWWLGGLGISVVGALGSAFSAFIKVARLPLLVGQGSAAWRSAQQRGLALKAGLGVIFFSTSMVLYYYASGLIAAFTMLAGVLLGAALILPVFLYLCIRAGARFSKKPLWSWFWADSQQQLSGLSLALMALLLALGTNIGVGSMVEGFRATFTEFLDERLAAEVYVYAPDAAKGDAIAAWLKEHDQVSAVLPYWRAQSQVRGVPVAVTGFQNHKTFRDTWRFLDATPNVWQAVESGTALLVNEQLARRQGFEVGDRITLLVKSGSFTSVVAGIYADYGNSAGAVRATLSLVNQHWPRAERRQFGVRVALADVRKLIADIQSEFDLSDRQVTDQATLKDYSNTVFEKTFTISLALNTLTLAVAGVAMLTSLLTLANARLAAVAPVWAMGIPRHVLSRLELLKVLMLALLTALAAVPLGVAVSWCLVAVVNVEAFGWRLPLYLYPVQWLELVALGVAAALLASLYPAVKLMNTSPARLAKIFSHER